jgi:hypothetical protein
MRWSRVDAGNSSKVVASDFGFEDGMALFPVIEWLEQLELLERLSLSQHDG